MHLSYLRPVSCIFTSWVSSGLTVGVAAVWWLLDGRSSFLPEFPQGSPDHIHGGCICWRLWHPLFTDRAGNIPFLTLKRVKELACETVWAWEGLREQGLCRSGSYFSSTVFILCRVSTFSGINFCFSHFWQAQSGHTEVKALRSQGTGSSPAPIQRSLPAPSCPPPGGLSWTEGSTLTQPKLVQMLNQHWWAQKHWECLFIDSLIALTWKPNGIFFYFSWAYAGEARAVFSLTELRAQSHRQGKEAFWSELIPFLGSKGLCLQLYCYTCRRKALEGRDPGCSHSGMLSAESTARGHWALGVPSKGGSLAAPIAGEERWRRGDAEKRHNAHHWLWER